MFLRYRGYFSRLISGLAARIGRRSLRTKLLLAFLLFAVASVVLHGILVTHNTRAAVQRSVQQNYQSLVEHLAVDVSSDLEYLHTMLSTTAALISVVYPASWKQETMLVELALNQPVFMRAAVFGLDGNLIAGSELTRGLPWQFSPPDVETVLKNGTFSSVVSFNEENRPYITVGVPLKKLGKVQAALVADVSLESIWVIIEGMHRGSSGRAFLVSADGTVLAHSDKKMVFQKRNFRQRPDVQNALAGVYGTMEQAAADGGSWLSAYAPVRSAGWALVFEQRADEAYVLASVLERHARMIIMLGLFTAVIGSIIMTNVLTRPIEQFINRLRHLTRDTHGAHSSGEDVRIELADMVASVDRMVTQLRQARKQDRTAEVSEPAAIIAHELRNCLVSLKMFVQLFPQRHTDEEFVNTFKRLLPPEVARWEHMLRELSDLSAYGKLDKVYTNVNSLIRDTMEMLRPVMVKQAIQLHLDLQESIPRALVDPERMRQVIMNLSMNAVEVMRQGGTLSVLSVLAQGAGGQPQVMLRFTDTGPGVSEELKEKIFTPFYTTRKEGKGLGLAICRRIIEQHGGTIQVDNAPHAGASFTISLPIAHK